MPIDGCLERVQIFIECANLYKAQSFSDSDTFAVVSMKVADSVNIIARTEIIFNNNNPKYPNGISLDYIFEMIQDVTIKIYHFTGGDKVKVDENKHMFLGAVNFQLANLMCSGEHKMELAILDGKKCGKVVVKGEPMHHTRDKFVVSFGASKLRNQAGFFGTSDPFLDISRYSILKYTIHF